MATCLFTHDGPTLSLQPSPSVTDDNGEMESMTVDWISPDEFYQVASETYSVCPFNKVAYPELHGSSAMPKNEPLYEQQSGVQR